MTSWPVELGGWPYRKTITRLGAGVSAAAGTMPLFVALASDSDILAADPNLNGIRVTTMDDEPVPFQRIGVDPSVLVGDAVHSWFTGPRALQAGRKVFYTWVSGHPVGASDAYRGGVFVGSYDLDNPTTAPIRTSLASPFGASDDHNNPSLLVRPDGRIVCFWCDHNGANIYYSVSASAGSIASMGTSQTIGTYPAGTDASVASSYPKFHFLSAAGNRAYGSWRGGDGTEGRPTICYSDDLDTVSSGAAASFTAIRLLNATGRAYVVTTSNGVDRIDFFTTDGHPDEVDTSAGHFYLDASAGAGSEVLRKTDGTQIATLASVLAGTPIDYTAITQIHTYSLAVGRAWTWDACYDTNGHPVVLYDVLPSSHSVDGTHDTNHKLWRAHWTGSAWVKNLVADTGESFADQAGEFSYAGGGFLNHEDAEEVVVSNGILGNHEIESRVKALDTTTTWTVTPVTQDSDYRQVRPVIPIGRSSDCFKFMWIELRSYVDYSTYQGAIRVSPSLTVPPAVQRTGAMLSFNVTTSNDQLRVYYGNPAAALTADGADVWNAGTLTCAGGEGDASLHTFRELTGRPSNAIRIPSATGTAAAVGTYLRGMSFDGTNTAKVYADPVDLHSAAWLVIQGWLIRSATGQRLFISNWQASTTLAGFLVRNSSSNTLEALIVTEANTSTGGAFGDLSIPASTLCHWAITLDPTNGLRGWLNGVASSTKYGTPGVVMDANASTNPIVYGGADFTTTQRLSGKLALVRVETRTFDDDEFRAEYLALTSQATMFQLGTAELRGLIGRASLTIADRRATALTTADRHATGISIDTE